MTSVNPATLKALRERLGLNLRQLSECGVSAAYISRVERGEADPSPKILQKIAKGLGVMPEDLTGPAPLLGHTASNPDSAIVRGRIRYFFRFSNFPDSWRVGLPEREATSKFCRVRTVYTYDLTNLLSTKATYRLRSWIETELGHLSPMFAERVGRFVSLKRLTGKTGEAMPIHLIETPSSADIREVVAEVMLDGRERVTIQVVCETIERVPSQRPWTVTAQTNGMSVIVWHPRELVVLAQQHFPPPNVVNEVVSDDDAEDGIVLRMFDIPGTLAEYQGIILRWESDSSDRS